MVNLHARALLMYDLNREQITEVSTKSSFQAMIRAVLAMQSSVWVRRVLSRYFDTYMHGLPTIRIFKYKQQYKLSAY